MKLFISVLMNWFIMHSNVSGHTHEDLPEKLEIVSNHENKTIFYVLKAKRLLEWNKEKLTSHSKLNIHDIEELFAPAFVVLANGRKYDANYQNYNEFLNQFRANIATIDYEVQEYLNCGSAVVIPLKATVKRLNNQIDIFNAIMLIKFNDEGKILHWQEVYTIANSL